MAAPPKLEIMSLIKINSEFMVSTSLLLGGLVNVNLDIASDIRSRKEL